MNVAAILFLLLFILLQLFTRNKGRDEDGQGGAVIMRSPGQDFKMDHIPRPLSAAQKDIPLTDAQKRLVLREAQRKDTQSARQALNGKWPFENQETSSGCCGK
jgi:hypothetical protein